MSRKVMPPRMPRPNKPPKNEKLYSVPGSGTTPIEGDIADHQEGNNSLAELVEEMEHAPVSKLKKDRENVPLSQATLKDFANLFERFIKSDALTHIFFGEEEIKVRESFKTMYLHNLLQYCMKKFFKGEGYENIMETSSEFMNKSESVVEVQCDIDETFEAYNNAIIFLYNKETGGKAVVNMEHNYHQKGVNYEICCNKTSEYVWKKWCDFSKENNFYKVKKIDAQCKFLNINPDINWDSIVLSPKTRLAVKKNIENIFKHRGILQKNNVQTKRGVIFAGIPGCVTSGTKITIRKKKEEGKHNIVDNSSI